MWILQESENQSDDTFLLSNPISVAKNKILIDCSVLSKPTWRSAGNAFVSDNDIKIISLQREHIYLGKPQLIIINPEIIELLSGYFYILFEPNRWIAEWGYAFKLYYWENE